MKEFLSVLMIQMNYDAKDDGVNEYNVKDKAYWRQMRAALKVIEEKKPDITLFTEMAYDDVFDEDFTRLSQDRIIVAGSHYEDGFNKTVVFQNGSKVTFEKRYASGAEVMARHITYMDPETFIKEHLWEHEFIINGKKVYILNCLEYYHTAYYIARHPELQKDLFGFFVICSNSNTKVFEQETVCIHNHNEHVYSFVVNTVGTRGKSHGDGQSYIYGPISGHEKEWLHESGYNSKMGVATHVVSLSEKECQYVYGEFLFAETLSLFGRSDFYKSNPRNVTVETLDTVTTTA